MTRFCGFLPDTPFFLAPMAGVTDSPFRTICAQAGAAVTYTEMISAKALVYQDKKTAALLQIAPDHQPCVVQIFGSDPAIMAEGARIAAARCPAAAIDINMGCPVPKVAGHGEGSALMGDLPRAEAVIRAVKAAVSLPVTVKFRSGLDDAHRNGVEFAKLVEQAGADALAIHGRTREQMYHGPSDRAMVAAVKQAVTVPVIASGDAWSAGSCMEILTETGADFVMIARGAQGNPMIFTDCRARWRGEPLPVHRAEELTAVMRRHAALCAERKGSGAMVEMRKHGLWYLDRLRGGRKLKPAMSQVSTLEEYEAVCAAVEAQGLTLKEGNEQGHEE